MLKLLSRKFILFSFVIGTFLIINTSASSAGSSLVQAQNKTSLYETSEHGIPFKVCNELIAELDELTTKIIDARAANDYHCAEYQEDWYARNKEVKNCARKDTATDYKEERKKLSDYLKEGATGSDESTCP